MYISGTWNFVIANSAVKITMILLFFFFFSTSDPEHINKKPASRKHLYVGAQVPLKFTCFSSYSCWGQK